MYIFLGQRRTRLCESESTNIEKVTEKHSNKGLEMNTMKNGASRQSDFVKEKLRIILVEEPNILKYDRPDGIVSKQTYSNVKSVFMGQQITVNLDLEPRNIPIKEALHCRPTIGVLHLHVPVAMLDGRA